MDRLYRAKELHDAGERLVKKFHTRDPFRIADALGVHVLFCSDFGSLKGMYKVILRNRFIFINEDLDERLQKIVCAHELGHDQLHRSLADMEPVYEFSLYNMNNRTEYEANVVASAILLDDDELKDYIYRYNYSAEEIAALMQTDINLVTLKIAHLNELGCDLRSPLTHRSDFLR